MARRRKFRFVLAACLLASSGRSGAVDRDADAVPKDSSAAAETAAPTGFRNPSIESARLLQYTGARPRWDSAGVRFAFDRRNLDGLYDLYLSDRDGNVLHGFTSGSTPFSRHAGNGRFRPTGGYMVFVAEEPTHYLDWASPYGTVPLGEPGVGLFNNLWATDSQRYWKLTNIPLKQTLEDGLFVYATVNPIFSPNGSTIVWTERYAEGGNNNWGRWRLKVAGFRVTPNGPSLFNERVLYTPTLGTYVTAMEFINGTTLLVSGNLDGQHEYGMDLYALNVYTGSVVNLTPTPLSWEEGSCIGPSGRIVFMSNRESRFPLDFNVEWSTQLIERDYWVMNSDGTGLERLTYFNDPSAPEYLGWRAVTIACDVSPDGRTIAATIGRDFGDEVTPSVRWQVWLIELKQPL